ncbi:MAG: P1 family peptidase, partial [Clostridia bacterium]|nr:P1 family peptidase [Clostridia bacterium]
MNTKRIRDYGITIGELPTGPRNKLSDIPGVTVGHFTLDNDRHKTGVTVILPAQ